MSSKSTKVIAIESSRKEASMNGDLRQLISAEHGQTLYVKAANGRLHTDSVNKVDLSTARLAEFIVARSLVKGVKGFVFLPGNALAGLSIKSGEPVEISLEVPSASNARRDVVEDDEPVTKADKILAVVKLLDVGTKVQAAFVIDQVSSRYSETVDSERVRAVLSKSDLVVVTKATVGRGNTYERVEV